MSMPLTSPPADATLVLLRMAPPQIAYFHAICEGYDDLCAIRTLVPREGLVEVRVSPGSEAAFEALLDALGTEGLPVARVEAAG